MSNNLNILNKLQFNKEITISSIIIIFEFIILFLLLFKIISFKKTQDLVSPLIVLNFFIIFVMFLTSCKVDSNTKLWVVSLKIILLFIVLLIAKFTFKNYFIGLIFLFIYFITSDINNVYSCNINMLDILNSFILSTIIYILLISYQHSTSKPKY
jgi:hypothetical protein